MKLNSKAFVGSLVTAAATALFAQPAVAVGWYSLSAPLKVYENNVVQGAAYGNFANANQSYAKSKSTRKDWRKGGDGIFVETHTRFLVTSCSQTGGCTTQWVSRGAKQTGRTESGAWVTSSTQTALHAQGSRARGEIKVCEDQKLSKDPCSVRTYPTFDY